MNRFVAAAAFSVLALARPASAHPGAGIVVTPAGTVYFVVIGQSAIYRIAGGRLGVLVADERLGLPHHLVLDRAGNVYTISDAQRIVWRVSADGAMTQVMQGPAGTWGDPFTMDSAGNVYSVTETERSRIVRVGPDGSVTPLAGGEPGFRDGPASVARFGDLHFSAMALAPDGRLFVTDGVRVRVVAPDGTVSSIATAGLDIGRGVGLALDGPDVLVADYATRRVVRLGPSGAAVVPGSADLWAAGVAPAPEGGVYVLDVPPLATCAWLVREGERSKLGCVRPQGGLVVYAVAALTALLAAGLALRPVPRRTTYVLALILTGFLTAAAMGLATNARLDLLRPVLAGLFAAAVVLPIADRKRKASVAAPAA